MVLATTIFVAVAMNKVMVEGSSGTDGGGGGCR